MKTTYYPIVELSGDAQAEKALDKLDLSGGMYHAIYYLMDWSPLGPIEKAIDAKEKPMYKEPDEVFRAYTGNHEGFLLSWNLQRRIIRLEGFIEWDIEIEDSYDLEVEIA